MTSPEAILCPECRTEIAPGLLSCPSCARLVHSEKLRDLARGAEDAERGGRWTEALTAWREAVQYLPPGSRQREVAQAKIVALSGRVEAGGHAQAQPWWKRASALGPVGVLA